MRLKYSTTSPAQNEFDSLPRLPLLLRRENMEIEVVGLVDSGATVNVLPYELGLGLGETWDDRRAIIQLAGNLSSQPAIPVSAIAQIGEFPPVELLFAWVKRSNIPLILGQTNFFLNLMFVSTVLRWNLKSSQNLLRQPAKYPQTSEQIQVVGEMLRLFASGDRELYQVRCNLKK